MASRGRERCVTDRQVVTHPFVSVDLTLGLSLGPLIGVCSQVPGLPGTVLPCTLILVPGDSQEGLSSLGRCGSTTHHQATLLALVWGGDGLAMSDGYLSIVFETKYMVT